MYAIYGGILFLGRNVISTMQYGKPPLESSAPRAVFLKRYGVFHMRDLVAITYNAQAR